MRFKVEPILARILAFSLLAVLASCAPAQPSQTYEKTFVYHAVKDLNSVNIAGTFNGWDKMATPMSHDGRTWSITLKLPIGETQYKFILNGDTWITDPENKLTYDDGNGDLNSLIVMMPPDYDNPAAKGDGVIAKSALFADQTAIYLNYDQGDMDFSFRVRPGDVQSEQVIVNGKAFPLTLRTVDDVFEIDEAKAPWDRKTNLSYDFKLQDGSLTEYYGPNGVKPNEQDAGQFQVDAATFKPFEVPDWPQHSVIYQIFPDRFADGDKSNDPPNVEPWDGKPTFSNFFGGDTTGVDEHIPYLKELGIGAIYFNPIFESPTNHRYETTDYFKVDPRFGTNEQFVKLCDDLHQNDIKVVLDGVFNHTATNFFPFKDIMENGPSSKYTNWYFIKSYPVRPTNPPPYVAWFGYPSLPKLHIDNPETERYMLGIPQYWDKQANIDGWRLDAANEIVDSYWRNFRPVVKESDPNRWIVGELWTDASHYLGGDMWDSVMGYQFRQAAIDFVATGKITPSKYMHELMNLYESYPPQVSRNLMNLLDSHDTERFLNTCNGDDKLLRLGATMQLTWPGAPCIYYGDELGMAGGHDPDDRRPMRWDLANSDNATLRHYRLLVRARDLSKALETGDPLPLDTDDAHDVLAYARVLGGDSAVVVANRSQSGQSASLTLAGIGAAVEKSYEDVLSGRRYDLQDGILTVPLPAESSAVLLPVKEAEAVRATVK